MVFLTQYEKPRCLGFFYWRFIGNAELGRGGCFLVLGNSVPKYCKNYIFTFV